MEQIKEKVIEHDYAINALITNRSIWLSRGV